MSVLSKDSTDIVVNGGVSIRYVPLLFFKDQHRDAVLTEGELRNAR